MFNSKIILGMNLQLFADGGDGGAGAAGASGVSAGDAGQQNTGVAAANAGANGDAGQQPTPEEAFEQLIKGQFKEQFGKSVEDILRKRMSGVNRQLQEHESVRKQFDAVQPILEFLAQRYGKEITDLEGISKATQEDVTFFREEAMALGMDEKELMEMRRIQWENKSMQRRINQFEQAEKNRQMQQEAAQQAQKWQGEADTLKQMYPSFDLDTELQNQDFKRMLQNGIPMKAAYTALHADEIMQGAMQFAAQRTQQRVTDSIIAGATRPSENGTGAQGAVSPTLDPKKLTDDQIAKINEDVRRGKRVVFT